VGSGFGAGRAAPAVEEPAEPPSLAAARRMDAAARTAGALAHEIANYLGTIRGTLYLLGEKLGHQSRAQEELDALARTLDGAGRFVDALRRFAHPQPLGTGSAELNAVLREAEPALRGALRPDATLSLELAPGPLKVRGDRPRVRELAVDLVAGVGHTLGAGGRLEIETRRAPDRAAGGPAALLLVRVTGPGLDREHAGRLFEPFVFDRAYDGGLRLPTVYATVTASGGTMSAVSDPDAGTTILVTLPIDAASGRRRKTAP
jgi:C4-dicarboxylate-specific signal transduction histidine kinase